MYVGRKKECLLSVVGGGVEVRSVWEVGFEMGVMCVMVFWVEMVGWG